MESQGRMLACLVIHTVLFSLTVSAASHSSHAASALPTQGRLLQSVNAVAKTTALPRKKLPPPPKKVIPRKVPPPPPKAAVPSPGKGKIVEVGGVFGWKAHVYKTWRQPLLYVGDQLLFRGPNPPTGYNRHSVFTMPNKLAFDKCDFSNAPYVGKTSIYTTPPFPSPGIYYYACGCCDLVKAHCLADQKIAVKVLAR